MERVLKGQQEWHGSKTVLSCDLDLLLGALVPRLSGSTWVRVTHKQINSGLNSAGRPPALRRADP